MHKLLHDQLRTNTFLLQFYIYLTRGFFTEEELKQIVDLINQNIGRINIYLDDMNWDGRYDLVTEQLFRSKELVKTAKEHLRYKQICMDEDIAIYLKDHFNEFWGGGILLKDLKGILDIDVLFRNGYMLHDRFNGYPEKNLYRFQIDCIDYLHSASHFYNEAYDFYNNIKDVHYPETNEIQNLPEYSFRRIQPKEEVMFRNFRESYINLIFFIESFVNSVGFDAYLAGFGKTYEEGLHLKGIQKENPNNGHRTYSDFKQRLKNFARIIGNETINLSVEPYKSYIENSIELRNQYVHSNPTKSKIHLGIEEWKKKCDLLIDHECFDLLNSFWRKCYPHKVFPKVIFNDFYGNSFKGHQGRMMVLE